MLTVALKGLLAHKLRLAMTALSVAVGVAFVAGTLILTDTLNASFGRASADRYAGVDIVVRSQSAFDDGDALGSRQPLPETLLADVRSVPGVADAEGAVNGFAMMVSPDGRAIGTGAFATVGLSTHDNPALGGAVAYASGRAPSGGGEVAIDAATASKHDLAVGDRIQVLFTGPPGTFTVVGVARFGGIDSLGGGTAALFDTPTAQRVMGRVGGYDTIDVQAADGTAGGQLADRLSKALGAEVEVATGSAVADEGAQRVKDGLAFVNSFLLVFAAIAVFVGSFIIWNTFSIVVAQRGREIALLRALGATRRQVTASVLTEGLAVGVLASAVGLVAGFGLARGLAVLLGAVGLEVPAGSPVVALRTVVVATVVGTAVTVVASLAPARAAARVAPVEALRDATPGSFRTSRRRVAVGAVVTATGLLAIATGLFAGAGVALVGGGVLVTFIGVTALMPVVARPVATVLGVALIRFGGVAGRLARDNVARNPKRTAATAASLMIGLGMVVSVSVLAASLKASIDDAVDRTGRAELIVAPVNSNGGGISPAAADMIRGVPGVATVSEIAYGAAKVDGDLTFVTPIDPATIERTLDLGVETGSVADLAETGLLVYEPVARARGWTVGSEVPVSWAQTGEHPLRVAGTFAEKGAVDADYLVSLATYDANTTDRLDTLVLVGTKPGASVTATQDAVTAALADYPNSEVLTAAEFKKSVSGQVDDFLVVVVAMLLLAVLIALLGIVNTLALSVFERTRELGLLRAVGASRRQVRAMVRWESVVIAVFGALAGALVGVGFGVVLAQALHDDGVTKLVVPGGQLAGYVLLAGAAGVLAAVGPARRAARVDVLRAVVTE